MERHVPISMHSQQVVRMLAHEALRHVRMANPAQLALIVTRGSCSFVSLAHHAPYCYQSCCCCVHIPVTRVQSMKYPHATKVQSMKYLHACNIDDPVSQPLLLATPL